MENDLISRSALKETMFQNEPVERFHPVENRVWREHFQFIEAAPTVDAVVLPKGKPGDFVEWNTGAGFTNIYRIQSIIIGEDFVRYDLGRIVPLVDDENIVRIMSKEEAAKEMIRRCDYGK